MTEEPVVLVEVRGRVGLLRLNRPKARNAINRGLIEDLDAALRAMSLDEGIGCVVIAGSEAAFAAGADIGEMRDRDFIGAYLDDFLARWDDVSRFRKPMIAAVSGYALGGGCELALMCDLVIASETAQFGQPEIRLGVIPGAGGSQRLTRAVGKAKAMDLCLTGRMMGADEAERAGLVSRIAPASALLDEALKIAEEIARMSLPIAMMVKESVNCAFESTLSEGLRSERRLFYAAFAAQDQKEGMSAFLEKARAAIPEPLMGGLNAEAVGLLVATALVASFIDAIAGGGGLLTLPALALAGLDPISAVATNKLQSSFGAASATFAFWRAGELASRSATPIMTAAAAGAVLGAAALSQAPTAAASVVLPVVLIAVAIYFALSPRLSDRDARQRLPFLAFVLAFIPLIGFYDGVFGPGAGSFYVLGFVELMGFAVVRATACTKAANLASNMAALATFAFAGHIVIPIGLAMGAAQLVGARLGALATLRNGARLIRPLLIFMCLAMATRLALNAWRGG